MPAASDPHTALTLAGEFPGLIHLLITDVIMPRMNGLELGEAIGAVKSGYRCLFWSGYTSMGEVFGQDAGDGVVFLQKPFDPEMLLEKVRQVLRTPCSLRHPFAARSEVLKMRLSAARQMSVSQPRGALEAIAPLYSAS